MMAVELGHVSDMLKTLKKEDALSSKLARYSAIIRNAVWQNTQTPNGIFAYETNGFGGQNVMDDANVPSLVSLPYLGFLPRNDSTYIKTKKAMFSRANPYFAIGQGFSGIG